MVFHKFCINICIFASINDILQRYQEGKLDLIRKLPSLDADIWSIYYSFCQGMIPGVWFSC